MADKTNKTRLNFGAFIFLVLSFVCLLAGYLVYTLLPVSDGFTNSTDISGAQTVSAFNAAPILITAALISFVVFNAFFCKYLLGVILSDNTFGEKEIKPLILKLASFFFAVAAIVLLAISTAFSFMLLNEFKQLGFVAPVTDTKYESYGNFILADCIIHFVLSALAVAKMAGVRILDVISRVFNKDKEVKA